jgi:hypothetical protein
VTTLCRILLQKLSAAQPVNVFLAFYESRKVITCSQEEGVVHVNSFFLFISDLIKNDYGMSHRQELFQWVVIRETTKIIHLGATTSPRQR